MQKYKWIFSFSLMIIIMAILTSSSVFAGTLNTTQDKVDKNKYYFVSNFYHDIWKRSNGQWTSDGHPGEGKTISFDYQFDFPGRKIINVTVTGFDPTKNLPIENIEAGLNGATQVYKNSRYGTQWASARATVSNNYLSSNSNFIGKGTSSAEFTVTVVGDLTANIQPEDTTSSGGGGLADGVEGQRYYFPSLITIELEPEGGTAEIRHYTTTGQRLNGVGGFTDEIKDLKVGTNYSFRHTSGTVDYIYKGYKTSEESVPSGGSIEDGDPPALNPYDGIFPVYYINYYYEPKIPIDIPVPPNCTVPAPEQTILRSNSKNTGRHAW